MMQNKTTSIQQSAVSGQNMLFPDSLAKCLIFLKWQILCQYVPFNLFSQNTQILSQSGKNCEKSGAAHDSETLIAFHHLFSTFHIINFSLLNNRIMPPFSILFFLSFTCTFQQVRDSFQFINRLQKSTKMIILKSFIRIALQTKKGLF